MNKNKATPSLRFPGFKEPWKEKKISDLLEKRSEPVTVESNSTYREIGVRSHGRGVFHKEPILGAALGDKRVFHVVPHTLVLNIVFAWEQAVAILTEAEEGFIASHRFPMYAEKDGQSYIPFMHALFLRPRGKFLLELASPGGAGRNKTLGQEEFGKLIVTVPERREQVKIAGFLAALDSKIEQLERKRLLLGAYRKGCVADIFAQNLRFGAEKSGEWRECVFGSVYEFKPTNSLSREALNYDTGSVRNIHYGDIHTKFSPMFYLNREFVPFINDDIDIRSIPEDRYCRAGDLVIADASEDYADIGKTVEIMDLEGAKVLAGLHTLLARRLGNDLVPGFGAVVMGSEAVRMQMKLLAQGTKVLGISPGRIEKIKLPIPPKAEQEAIVAFVRAMDAKVASLTKMIDATRALRRGLSQELFV